MFIHFYSGKVKNKTESDTIAKTRFYEPATSCEELLKIGYTRNGFYLLKGHATSNNSHVEIVNCAFQYQNPNGVKEGKKLQNKLNIYKMFFYYFHLLWNK